VGGGKKKRSFLRGKEGQPFTPMGKGGEKPYGTAKGGEKEDPMEKKDRVS